MTVRCRCWNPRPDPMRGFVVKGPSNARHQAELRRFRAAILRGAGTGIDVRVEMMDPPGERK